LIVAPWTLPDSFAPGRACFLVVEERELAKALTVGHDLAAHPIPARAQEPARRPGVSLLAIEREIRSLRPLAGHLGRLAIPEAHYRWSLRIALASSRRTLETLRPRRVITRGSGASAPWSGVVLGAIIVSLHLSDAWLPPYLLEPKPPASKANVPGGLSFRFSVENTPRANDRVFALWYADLMRTPGAPQEGRLISHEPSAADHSSAGLMYNIGIGFWRL
jgi:hypothetical protein